MTIELLCTLLLAVGTLSTVIVEFAKKLLDSAGMTFTPQAVVWILFEGICVVMGSQLGYDKIVAVIKQIAAKKT